MSFCCPIHGYYEPTPGTTVAICPQCQTIHAPAPAAADPAPEKKGRPASHTIIEMLRDENLKLRAEVAALKARRTLRPSSSPEDRRDG